MKISTLNPWQSCQKTNLSINPEESTKKYNYFQQNQNNPTSNIPEKINSTNSLLNNGSETNPRQVVCGTFEAEITRFRTKPKRPRCQSSLMSGGLFGGLFGLFWTEWFLLQRFHRLSLELFCFWHEFHAFIYAGTFYNKIWLKPFGKTLQRA